MNSSLLMFPSFTFIKYIGWTLSTFSEVSSKNDVFRLTELIDPTAKITVPQGVYTDVQEFVQRMQNESVNVEQLGLKGRTKDQILDELKDLYIAQ